MSDYYTIEPEFLLQRVKKQHFADEVKEAYETATKTAPTQTTEIYQYLLPIFTGRFGIQERGDVVVILETGVCLIMETRDAHFSPIAFARVHKETDKVEYYTGETNYHKRETEPLDLWFLDDDIVRAWDSVAITLRSGYLSLDHDFATTLRGRLPESSTYTSSIYVSTQQIKELRHLRDTLTIKEVAQKTKSFHSSSLLLDLLIKPYLQNNDWKADGWPNIPLSKLYDLPLPDSIQPAPLDISRDTEKNPQASWVHWMQGRGLQLSDIEVFWFKHAVSDSNPYGKAFPSVLCSKGDFFRRWGVLWNAQTALGADISDILGNNDAFLLFSDLDYTRVTWRHLLVSLETTSRTSLSHSCSFELPIKEDFPTTLSYLCSEEFLTSSPAAWELISTL
jgi:hypothetical protein